jgi:hypothetical protein
MGDEDQGQTGMIGRDPAVQQGEIIEAFLPTVALREKTEVGRADGGETVAA